MAELGGNQGQTWTEDRVHLVRSRLGATVPPRKTSLASRPLRAVMTGPTDGPVKTTG